MLSDAKIASYWIKRAVRMFDFDRPQNRRDLAAALRRCRIESGAKAARLMLAQWSALALQK